MNRFFQLKGSSPTSPFLVGQAADGKGTPREGLTSGGGASFSSVPHIRGAKGTFVRKLFSVRVLLLGTFTFQVVFLASLSYGITSFTQTQISTQLSEKILDNVVARVALEIEDYFYFPWAAARAAEFVMPTEKLTYEELRPTLWNLWQQSNGQLVDTYLCTVKEGNIFGYVNDPDISSTILIIYLNKTRSPDQWMLPIINDQGLGNFSDLSSIFIVPNYTIENRAWWTPSVQGKTQAWSDAFVDPSFPEYVFFTVINSIVDPITNESVYLYAIDITSRSLLVTLETLDISENAVVWVIENDGAIIAISKTTEVTDRDPNTFLTYAQKSNLPLVKETTIHMLSLNEQSESYKFSIKLHGGQEVIAHVTSINKSGVNLKLLVAYPSSDFLGVVAKLQRLILIVSAAALFGSLIVGIWVMYLITKPLTKLGYQMDMISGGSFESTLLQDAEGKTKLFEIHSLQLDFQRMVNALRSFGRFVPVDIVRYLLRNNTEAEVSVSQKELTVMFSDIKDFTRKVEEMSPDQLSILLSDYLNSMCAVIGDNQGTVDKFIGDAIMALWNVPTSVNNHALCSARCALQSLESLKQLNVKWHSTGLPHVECRIGIHTGKALVGNLGSKERLAFTAVGDNVNLASRLEGLNKKYGTSILVSGEVYQQIRHLYLCRYLDVVIVQGRTNHTHIYELILPLSEASPQQVTLCNTQAEALSLFLKRQFTASLELYTWLSIEAPEDLSIKMLRERATEALLNSSSLPANWTGYYLLDSK